MCQRSAPRSCAMRMPSPVLPRTAAGGAVRGNGDAAAPQVVLDDLEQEGAGRGAADLRIGGLRIDARHRVDIDEAEGLMTGKRIVAGSGSAREDGAVDLGEIGDEG